MVEIKRELLGMFIKAEHVPDSLSVIVKLDVTYNRTIKKFDKDYGVGKFA
jgi:hypothetical protein